MSRKDVFGVEVEVGDLVFSAPRHKHSGLPEVGRVSNVSSTGRVSIQIPSKVTIYAYQKGAPDVEKETYRWVPDMSADPDRWGRRPYIQKPEKYMSKDYTVVGHEWKWVRKRAADITLVVLRKGGEEKKDVTQLIAECSGFTELSRNLNLNYDAVTPELD